MSGLEWNLVTLIPRGIKICIWIKDFSFKVKGATQEYKQFEGDVWGLKTALEALQNCIPRAQTYFSRYGIFDSSDPNHGAMLGLEATRFIGDFNHTLNVCEGILRDNEVFKRDKAGFIEKIRWTLAEQRINDMRARITFHTGKVQLMAKTFELGLCTQIAARIEDIWTEMLKLSHRGLPVPVQGIALDSFQLPDYAAEEMMRIFELAPPSHCKPGESTKDLRLDVGIDVLYYHSSEAQLDGTSNIQRDVSNRMHVLKTHWLILVLEDSRAFQDERPGSFYRAYLEEQKAKLARFYSSHSMPILSDDTLRGLDESRFLVGLRGRVNEFAHSSEPREQEFKILTVPLKLSSRLRETELIAYRKGTNELRLFSRNKNGGQPEPLQRGGPIVIPRDRYSYSYGFEPIGSRDFKVEICAHGGNHADPVEFKSKEDLDQFHRVMTNCEVFYECPNVVQWELSRSVRKSVKQKHTRGIGRAQIWYWNPLHPWTVNGDLPAPVLDGHTDAAASHPAAYKYGTSSSDDGARSTSGSGRTSVFERCLKERKGQTGPKPALTPYAPMLVIYSETEKEHQVLLCLDLNLAVDTNATRCYCDDDYNNCPSIVIEKKWPNASSSEPFDVHLIPGKVSRKNPSTHTPNVGLISLPLELGKARHPVIDNHSVVTNSSLVEVAPCKMVIIKFSSPPAKHEFLDHLGQVLDCRNTEETEVREWNRNRRIISATPANKSSSLERLASLGGQGSSGTLHQSFHG